MTIHHKLWAASALVVAATLSGCFGSDDDEPVTPPTVTTVPGSAGVSGAAFVAFLLTLGADESSEPLGIGDTFAVPADETSEPAALS